MVLVICQEHVVDAPLLESRLLAIFESRENLMVIQLIFADLLCLASDLCVQIYELGLHHSLYRLILRLLVEVTGNNNRTVLEISLKVLTNFEALANALIFELFLGLQVRLAEYKLLGRVLCCGTCHRLLLVIT